MLDTEVGRAVCSGRLDVGLPESVHDYIDWKRVRCHRSRLGSIEGRELR